MSSSIVDFLYERFPFYERQGKKAYKPGMSNSFALDEYFGHPHRAYKTIHVAGTNGKGSTSSMLASIFQGNGYKTGLYTSPHVVDFGERIRVDGEMIPESYIMEFIKVHETYINTLSPSFFEVVTSLAFCYFRDQEVDVAVVEVGLGGRLDCTNVISPELSIITNISYDHADLLGETIPLIAGEKAGIIKHGVPVVIGESNEEYNDVFVSKAASMSAPLLFADKAIAVKPLPSGTKEFAPFFVSGGMFDGQIVNLDLTGMCQEFNVTTVLASVETLSSKFSFDRDNTLEALRSVVRNTGLMGRWYKMAEHPDIICDTGHNEAGIALLAKHVSELDYHRKHFVWGMVSDKDASQVVKILPRDGVYYLTQPSVERAMPVQVLSGYFAAEGLRYSTYDSVETALEFAKKNAGVNDLIIIGGSTFMVADAIKYYRKNHPSSCAGTKK